MLKTKKAQKASGTASTTRPQAGARSGLTTAARRIARNGKKINSSVQTAARDTLASVRGAATDVYQQGRAKAQDAEDTVEHWIVTRPFTSTLITLGVGLVLGRFWRRR